MLRMKHHRIYIIYIIIYTYVDVVLIYLITTSICVYNNRLHLHMCIFACMQIVPRELRPPQNLYVVIRTRENDDAKGLIASTKLAFYHARY